MENESSMRQQPFTLQPHRMQIDKNYNRFNDALTDSK